MKSVREWTLEEFKDPPKAYTAIPFWFINKLADGAELSRQVEEMVDKGGIRVLYSRAQGALGSGPNKTSETTHDLEIWSFIARFGRTLVGQVLHGRAQAKTNPLPIGRVVANGLRHPRGGEKTRDGDRGIR